MVGDLEDPLAIASRLQRKMGQPTLIALAKGDKGFVKEGHGVESQFIPREKSGVEVNGAGEEDVGLAFGDVGCTGDFSGGGDCVAMV